MTLGIDEVGRGAWAGPLVVGACVLNGAKIEGLTDSKALTKKQREKLAAEVHASPAIVAMGEVSNFEIDEIGLGEALRLATRRAVEKIQAECRAQGVSFDQIIIDGTINFLKDTPLESYVSTLKKADLLISSVSAAAICAKVYRDNLMSELSKEAELAPYGFEKHSGYGTAKHRAALAEFGVSEIHRKSFKPIAEILKQENSVSKNDDEIQKSQTPTAKQLGDKAEEKVADFLRTQGHEILSRNWRTKFCEIDIASKMDGKYYFTEVKFRKTADFGGGEAAISKKKIEQMRFAAEFFMHKNNIENAELELLGAIVEGEDFDIKDIFEI